MYSRGLRKKKLMGIYRSDEGSGYLGCGSRELWALWHLGSWVQTPIWLRSFELGICSFQISSSAEHCYGLNKMFSFRLFYVEVLGLPNVRVECISYSCQWHPSATNQNTKIKCISKIKNYERLNK